MKRVNAFISYSHDSQEHRKRVLEEIANKLCYDNIDPVLDQYTEHKPPRSWPAWMRLGIERAEYVLVVCTQKYRERFEGKAPRGRSQGTKWEGAIIELEMYQDELNCGDDEECRFIPVGFCKRNEAPVPRILSGTTFYNLADPDEYAALVRRLKGIPTAVKPLVGPGTSRHPLKSGWGRAPKNRVRPTSAEERYCALLRDELGTIRMMGSPDIPNLPVETLDTFVHLNISTAWHCEDRFGLDAREARGDMQRDLTPDAVVRLAFEKSRTLLIIGDPGSGKTTLMKYYAMSCLSGDGWRKLGFQEGPLPIYLPLRDTPFDPSGRPLSLAESLAAWPQKHDLDVSRDHFERWLRNRRTLLLLDGLDEIRSLESRRSVCQWIKHNAEDPRFKSALFVVTSRWTGYRRLDRVELSCPHLRADVRDFSRPQQDQFLTNWFTAAFLREPRPAGEAPAQWKQDQKQKALWHAQQIMNYLDLDRNKSIRDLAAVPLLLQIIAVIWKERAWGTSG